VALLAALSTWAISKMREFVLQAQSVLQAPFLTAIKITAQPEISRPRLHSGDAGHRFRGDLIFLRKSHCCVDGIHLSYPVAISVTY
jgi:hypothetical protein